MHDAVLGGARPPEPARRLVTRSWHRALAAGLDPDASNGRRDPDVTELARRRDQSPLSLVIDDLRSILTAPADASQFVVVVADADGMILWREGSARVRLTADRLGFAEGALWTERTVGTNAIGTALAEAAPVELFAAEHFEHPQHAWYCTAVPVHHPRSGELLGVVDISGPALTLHPALGALVDSAVRVAQASLWRHHQDLLAQLRRRTEHIVDTAGGPILVVDDDGWVAHRAGVGGAERVSVPDPLLPVAVPGIGLCRPERIDGGWLLRPAGESGVLTVALADRSLAVTGGGRNWRATLTPRHAQLLRHICDAGPTGVSAAALSRAVFGDDAHTVTVRAELSRLRRQLGALIATNPYRLAPGVRLDPAAPAAPATR